MKSLFQFIGRIFKMRAMIGMLALRMIKLRYVGTVGAFVWTILNPLLLMLVYWFIFSIGFKAQPVGNVPFLAVFLCGFIPWLLFSETLMLNVQAVTSHAYLVRKMVFPTEILPAVCIVSTLIIHFVFIAFLCVVLGLCHIPLNWFALQFFYYLAALCLLCLGIGWLVAALNVFSRDVAQFVAVLLNIWFWLTPIVWNLEILPSRYVRLIKLNPMYYIVQGYKDSFIYSTPFWKAPQLSLYFWWLSFLLLAAGGMLFKKLKREFADVL